MRRLLLALAVALPDPTIAAAQMVSGSPYFGAAGGLNFAGSPLSAGGTTQLHTDIGALGLADLGWAFSNGLQAEIEGSCRSNGLSSIDTLRKNGSLLPLGNPHGSLRTWAVMVNGKYDLPVSGLPLHIQPYIGAGLGYARLDLSGAGGNGLGTLRLPQHNFFTGPLTVGFGSAGAFAYQAFAGLAWPLPFASGLEATLEYRFFGTARADIPVSRVANTTNTINGAIPSASTHNGFVLDDNSVLVGLRYRF